MKPDDQLSNDSAASSRTRRRGRPPKDTEPRRRKIIEAAGDLFVMQGYLETTIDAIARRSGLNKRTIYDLVGDKEQLFREVCHHVAIAGELELDDALDEAGLHPSLMNLAQRLMDNSLSERTIALEKTVIAESRRFPELVEEIVAVSFREANTKVADFLGKLEQRGWITIDDGIASSELFFDIIVGQLVHRKALGQSRFELSEDYLDQRVGFFIDCHLSVSGRTRRLESI